MTNSQPYKILEIDPYLESYKEDIALRMHRFEETKRQLLGDANTSLKAFANGHLYFGFHRQKGGWVYREWAPNAESIALFGDFNNWDRTSHKMTRQAGGVWEISLPGANALRHGSKVKIEIRAQGRTFDRIPLYCRRVIQDAESKNFDGQVWNPKKSFDWTDEKFSAKKAIPPIIYECHIGMSGENPGLSTFNEFTDHILPRVKKLGYNTIQLMAIMEHPYYGSFGYQVSNFFAVSSRFGTPEDLKRLIDTAHSMGIAVLLDLIHSHAARNALEGIGEFDGTSYQFFHDGPQGDHPAWGTKLFDYAKPEILHFLLSNLKFWLEEYHFDGFRFDGITSMLYHDHGLGSAFDNYQKYFSMNTDTEAITYLQLAAELCKDIRPDSVLIAEDMSGMPGMCLPIAWGGIGFDYRLGMGAPDYWIRTLRSKRDEEWNLGEMWHELSQRRPQEKVIGYAESHDQALVGDKTIMFWLADQEMYWHMDKNSQSLILDRAIALHKMIRLVSITCAGDGYLNFMGNEFGHPEWIDFPREGNGWSYHYARRQWSLADNKDLRYQYLQCFDQAMIKMTRKHRLLGHPSELVYHDEANKILVFFKKGFLFIFNFHPTNDHTVTVSLNSPSKYQPILLTNDKKFGEYMDTPQDIYETKFAYDQHLLEVPTQKRSAIVCQPVKE